jgi:hypothetical protein
MAEPKQTREVNAASKGWVHHAKRARNVVLETVPPLPPTLVVP